MCEITFCRTFNWTSVFSELRIHIPAECQFNPVKFPIEGQETSWGKTSPSQRRKNSFLSFSLDPASVTVKWCFSALTAGFWVTCLITSISVSFMNVLSLFLLLWLLLNSWCAEAANKQLFDVMLEMREWRSSQTYVQLLYFEWSQQLSVESGDKEKLCSQIEHPLKTLRWTLTSHTSKLIKKCARGKCSTTRALWGWDTNSLI